MFETFGFLLASFWAGAIHAATPGHGKTISAAYIVGARGRPVDAVILGIFVTLSHTSGIVLVAVLASLGSGWLVPERTQAYLALLTGLMVVGIGLWMMWDMRRFLVGRTQTSPGGQPAETAVAGMRYRLAAEHALSDHDHVHPHRHDDASGHGHDHDHAHGHDGHGHGHAEGDDGGWHSHGWGPRHTHRLDKIADGSPSLLMLLGLGVAGGLLPDPAALALLLAQLAQGKLMLGLGVVLLYSLGFAGVLVLVGAVAAKAGQRILDWMTGDWGDRFRFGTAVLIAAVGAYLTLAAWQTLQAVGI